MPYSIRTKDGIVLSNIPDDMDPNDERLKQLVSQRRQQKRRDYFRSPEFQQKVEAQRAEDRDLYDPTSGMGGFEKVRANIGAGLANAGLGTAQLLLPKSVEQAVGITDESINEKRARDQQLAEATTGGKALQIGGEVLPMMAVPGGVVARGLGALPRIGTAVKSAGIGSRALPTLIAEGGALGAAQGAITPTTSSESTFGNAIMGGLGGAAIPGLLYGASRLVRPLSRGLLQREVAKKIADAFDVSPSAQRKMEKALAASSRRVVDSPQSAAALTQSPELAQLELAARANPDTAPSWARFDETAANARWKALADALGSEASVEAAKKATDSYASAVIPEVFKSVNRKVLSEAVTDFVTAVRGKLRSAVNNANPAEQEVYGYVLEALEKSDRGPQALWNIRKTLASWMDGAPPPGREGTRATKVTGPAREAVKAIDATLNRATGGRQWSKFLEKFGEYVAKEKSQKAGQNIRNAFFDETLATPRGSTTASGSPAVTRARLEQALARYGKDEFGETLDWTQRNVIDQVLDDLRADEILQRVKSVATGKGGSQTAPLLSLLHRESVLPNGVWLTEIAKTIGNLGQKKQREIVNRILQDPQDALLVIRQAERIKRPLTNSEKYLVQTARALAASPAFYALSNQRGQPTGESPQ